VYSFYPFVICWVRWHYLDRLSYTLISFKCTIKAFSLPLDCCETRLGVLQSSIIPWVQAFLRFSLWISGPFAVRMVTDQHACVNGSKTAIKNLLGSLIQCQRLHIFLLSSITLSSVTKQSIRKHYPESLFPHSKTFNRICRSTQRVFGTSTAIWPVCGLLLPLVRWRQSVILLPFIYRCTMTWSHLSHISPLITLTLGFIK